MALIPDKVTQFKNAADVVHGIAHGPASGADSIVDTDNGPVRSIAKLIADNQALIEAQAPSMGQLALSTGAEKVNSILAAAGARTRDLQRVASDFVVLDAFEGVDPTGATDSTAGIQAAVTYCNLTGKVLYGDGIYLIASTPNINCNASLSTATFLVPAARAVGVEVSADGSASPAGLIEQKSILLGRVINLAKPTVGWAGQGVGIRAVNMLSCDLRVVFVNGFDQGLLCTAFGSGFVHTNVHLVYAYDNKVNFKGRPGDAAAWFNENVLQFDRLHHNASREGANVPGVRHIQILPFDLSNAGTSWPNNNVLMKPSVEGSVPEFHIEIGGHDQLLIAGRYESSPSRVWFNGHATDAGRCTRNDLLDGYGVDLIEFTVTGAGKGGGLTSSRKKTHSGIGASFLMQNINGDVNTTPIRRLYSTTKQLLTTGVSDADWTLNEFANGVEYKRTGDAFPRFFIDAQNGRTYTGTGTAAPTVWAGTLAGNPTAWTVSASVYPLITGTQDLGAATLRWRQGHIQEAYVDSLFFGTTFSGVPRIVKGAGSPEGAATAAIGSMYLRIDGGAVTSLYVKESGTGNVGWVAK